MSLPGLDAVIQGPVGLIVHVGAGADGPGALARTARTAILIEPDPERAARLRAGLDARASVQVIEAAVAREAGRAVLHRYSHPAMNSPRPATGARRLFRGLAAEAEAIVDCVAPDTLITPDDFDGEGDNILLIDAASEVLDVLDALEGSGWLDRFDHVIARVSEIALHEGGAARADVVAWARARGRLMLALPGQTDPDLWRAWIGPPRQAGSSDALAVQTARVSELEAAIETWRAATREAEARWLEQRSALIEDVRTGQARYEALEAAAQDRSGQLEGEIEALREASSQAEMRSQTLREDLSGELQAARARATQLERAVLEAETARASAEDQMQSARNRTAELEASVRRAAQAHEAVQARVTELERQRNTLRDDSAQRDREIERFQAATRTAVERESALNAQIASARQDLRLALTGQRLVQASLADLQARYGALLDDRNALDALLHQLTDRLSSAAAARVTDAGSGGRTEWDV